MVSKIVYGMYGKYTVILYKDNIIYGLLYRLYTVHHKFRIDVPRLGSHQAGNESQTRILGSTGVWDPWDPVRE